MVWVVNAQPGQGDGVRTARVWARLLGVERAVVESVSYDEGTDELIVSVSLWRRERGRCGRCRRVCSRYDAGDGPRRWRTLDLGTTRAYIEAAAPRVRCPDHGVIVAAVPWARHGAGHSRAFDDQVAWLAAQCSKTAVTALMRVAWRTVGAVITRVVADGLVRRDPLDGLRRIGMDDISYRRGQRYLMVVVDHDSGRVVWVGEGRSEATVEAFFAALGPERAAALTHISTDAAPWMTGPVRRRAPGPVLCTDPFHVVRWATEALDALRRDIWNRARRAGDRDLARAVKGARWILYRAADELEPAQRTRFDALLALNAPLTEAYLLKEQLREVFAVRGLAGITLLDAWIEWAKGSSLAGFREVGRRVERHRSSIVATLVHGLSNARVEALNTRVRLLTRIAFGFHSARALIALIQLSLGGHCPPLPGR
jgi:transposase